MTDHEMSVEIITDLPLLPTRPNDGHKGTFGKVLIVAGSVGMSGAAALAGLGALRGGAGLVFVATPKSVLPIIAGIEPSYLTVPLAESREGRVCLEAESHLNQLAEGCDAVAIGPGIGRSDDLRELVVTLFRTVTVPVVIDADGLNALAEASEFESAEPMGILPSPRAASRILTPHSGEFARLIGRDVSTVENQRKELAVRYAERNGIILVLKGHRTLITDGQRVAENTTGNSGMATGGSGDVLTGLITALQGQKMGAFEAAHLGASLHGLAGDLAAAELSQPGMIASDLPRFLPAAWKQMEETQRTRNG